MGNVRLVCGLFGAGRGGHVHGVRTARLEFASCHIRAGSVWVDRGRFGHSERAVRTERGKRENGVRTAVGVWGNAFGVGSSENGVWGM